MSKSGRPIGSGIVAAEIRFWKRVEKGELGNCWIWLGAKTACGYGHLLGNDRRDIYAHRFSFEQMFGEIPHGYVIDHICHNKSCVNPYHLRLATNTQNVYNSKKRKDNASGLKGAYFCNTRRRWIVQIRAMNRSNYIGSFASADEAHGAYCDAAHRLHGEFANFGEANSCPNPVGMAS